jgi:hypothetical protein
VHLKVPVSAARRALSEGELQGKFIRFNEKAKSAKRGAQISTRPTAVAVFVVLSDYRKNY